MTIVHSSRYELRQSLLFKSSGVQIVEPFGARECTCQRLWYDQVTDTEGRKHSRGKCPDVDDASFRIQALQRLKRPAFVVELTIVIIFDDHSVLAAGPFKKLDTTCKRKNHAGWKLV